MSRGQSSLAAGGQCITGSGASFFTNWEGYHLARQRFSYSMMIKEEPIQYTIQSCCLHKCTGIKASLEKTAADYYLISGFHKIPAGRDGSLICGSVE